MRSNNKKQIIIFFLISTVFIFGIIHLFLLRFEAGDIYPEYSSLRSDPLGTKVFCAALKNLSAYTVQRNYLSFKNIDLEPNTTFFYLGAYKLQIESFVKSDIDTFNQILSKGGRIVISFFPSKQTASLKKNTKTTRKDPHSNVGKPRDPQKPLTQQWGFNFEYQKPAIRIQKAVFNNHPYRHQVFPDLSWHTTLYFTHLDNAWNVIYTHNNHPVVIEKKVGVGSIVLFADSYVFSNEALQKERRSEVLAWCIGKNSQVIFDEYHFGIQQHFGIADLVRRYRLYWLVIGIVIFSVLFVWKNATYFVPPKNIDKATDISHLTDTKDHAQGLITLIRKNVDPKHILDQCVSQWEKSFILQKTISAELKEKLKNVKMILLREHAKPKKQFNPVKTYQIIYQIFSKRKPL